MHIKTVKLFQLDYADAFIFTYFMHFNKNELFSNVVQNLYKNVFSVMFFNNIL